jgi:hypothetical protein
LVVAVPVELILPLQLLVMPASLGLFLLLVVVLALVLAAQLAGTIRIEMVVQGLGLAK